MYKFEYDELGRQKKVSVGSVNNDVEALDNLSENFYNADGTLQKCVYGNGSEVRNSYDDYKRIVGVQIDSDTKDRYSYDYNAEGKVGRVIDTILERKQESEYDFASRPIRSTTSTMDGANVYTAEVKYDSFSNLSAFNEKVGEEKTAFKTDFTYDVENKPTLITFGDTNNKVAYTYDKLGRMLTRAVTNSGNKYTGTYSYVAGGHGTNSTTSLVETINQAGHIYTYTYDDVGNIISVIHNGNTTMYDYDELGQLIREENQEAGFIWEYTYDLGGNILTKNKYERPASSLEEPCLLETIDYAYGDTKWNDNPHSHAKWMDKLTKYNGVDIEYDAIGNPLTDGTWTYTWQNGRQLQSMVNGEKTVSFTYNANGLRTSKTVVENGVTTQTEYFLHGKLITHMKRGSDELHFFYDAQSRPAMVDLNGVKYSYVHNLQGDVVGLLDSTGTEVVTYTYDAWGQPLSVTGSKATDLGEINPFRYRGYVFDVETGMYYLRSRYYDVRWNRFLSSDVIVGKIGEIFSSNVFSYCKNAVTISTDPLGTDIIVITDLSGTTHTSLLVQGWFGTWYYLYWGADGTDGSSAMIENAFNNKQGNGKLIYEGIDIKVDKNDIDKVITDVNDKIKEDPARYGNPIEYDMGLYLNIFSIPSHCRAGYLKAHQDKLTYNLLTYNCAQLSLDVLGYSVFFSNGFDKNKAEEDMYKAGKKIIPALIHVYLDVIDYYNE